MPHRSEWCTSDHVLVCAVPGCGKLGFRGDACCMCGEYRCEEHAEFPIQGNRMNQECITILDPKTGEEKCMCCGNVPPRTEHCLEQEYREKLSEQLEGLRTDIDETLVRQKPSLVLLDRFRKMVTTLDNLDSSPLEQSLWTEMIIRGLDRYFEPQIELYERNGDYIVRADFASTMLKIAVFTDGRTYHSKPDDVARDEDHNRRLMELGYLVLRYWTEAIEQRRAQTADEIYHYTAERVARIHESVDWEGSIVRDT